MEHKRILRIFSALILLGTAIAVIPGVIIPRQLQWPFLSPHELILSTALCICAWFLFKGVPERNEIWWRTNNIQLSFSIIITMFYIFWICLATEGIVKGPPRFESIKQMYFLKAVFEHMTHEPDKLSYYADMGLELSENGTGESARMILREVSFIERFRWSQPEYFIGPPLMATILSYYLRKKIKRPLTENAV